MKNKGVKGKMENEEQNEIKIDDNANDNNETNNKKEKPKATEEKSAYKKLTNKMLDEHIKKKRKRVLIGAIKYLSLNHISVKDYLRKKFFPVKPFELRGSEEFIEAVKFNQIELVKQGLKRSRAYLIQYDYFQQTPLHWAAKLGYDEVLRVLLQNANMINLYDRELRTPLYLAALNNHKKCAEILLEYGASAYFRDKNGELAENITTDPSIRLLLQNSQDKLFSEINEINKKKPKNEEENKK